jgi:hypothetical protein
MSQLLLGPFHVGSYLWLLPVFPRSPFRRHAPSRPSQQRFSPWEGFRLCFEMKGGSMGRDHRDGLWVTKLPHLETSERGR